jgi:hypothetical protein
MENSAAENTAGDQLTLMAKQPAAFGPPRIFCNAGCEKIIGVKFVPMEVFHISWT